MNGVTMAAEMGIMCAPNLAEELPDHYEEVGLLLHYGGGGNCFGT